jgi:lysophospholipase L1-like esterase
VVPRSALSLWTRLCARGGTLALLVCALSCGGSPAAPAPPPTPQLAITCPASVERTSIGGQPVPISYDNATATGGTTPVSISCTPSAGTSFATGATSVTCTASDNAGRQASCAFTVTVTGIPLRLSQTRFMAFGDSLTEGKVGEAPTLNASPFSYPMVLQRLLDERYTGQTIVVVNEGWGGESVHKAETFARFASALSTNQPGALLLMHGVNDLNDGEIGESARINRTARALEEFVAGSRHSNLAVFLATLPPLGPGPKAGCPGCVQPLNDRIRAIAPAYGAVLVDVYAAFTGGSALMGTDGIHPTTAGYEVIARTFLDAIRRTLEVEPGAR